MREAKQRFRDTLPKGYLTAEEYALYERLYGPPLRETTPDDVGIPMHADMNSDADAPRPDNEGTLLRELEGGGFEEVNYEITPENAEGEQDGETETAVGEESVQDVIPKPPTYIDSVARNPREREAMERLMQDFETSQKLQKEVEEAAAAKEETEAESLESSETSLWPLERQPREVHAEERGEQSRYHPYSLAGKFHDSPVEISLPRDELISPIREILGRTHPRHVQEAAEAAFGGPGLPTSPATFTWSRSGNMGGVGLAPGQRHMTEIEADAFLTAYVPPAYASSAAILREVRKRIGSEWLQSRLKQGPDGGLNVLDVGTGGAALLAWEQIVNAEWELLKEKGEVHGEHPPGKKAVVASSDRLRNRIKSFLHNTSILPRLPDYEHSGQTTSGEHLEAGSQPQPRKVYDVIIASHLLVAEKQDHYRQAIVNSLWSLLSKDGGVLIIVEKAHPRGFEAVAHVRQTLLDRYLLPQSGESTISPEDFNPAFHRELEPGHIIAPCTTHSTCPMYTIPGKSVGRKDYCHFSQRFVRPEFYTRVLGNMRGNEGEVEFSYLAVRRGKSRSHAALPDEATARAFEGYEHSPDEPDMLSVPRIVLPPLKRKGHITLDLCTPDGTMERWTVPKSFSKLAYHDARKSRWGDLWTLGAKTRVPRKTRSGKGPDDGGKRAAQSKKKPRVVNVTFGPDGSTTMAEKNAPLERRSKGRKPKQRDMMHEVFGQAEEEEAEEEALMMEEEVEGDEERQKRG